MEKKDFLLIGGSQDQEMVWFIERLIHSQKYNIIKCLLEENKSPNIEWKFNEDILLLNKKEIKPSYIWLRQDVFQEKHQNLIRGKRWHHFMQGWLLVHPEVKVINRKWLNRFGNKMFNLSLAKKLGFDIPKTNITNNLQIMESILEKQKSIIKPIDNGYCEPLKDILEKLKEQEIYSSNIAPSPAFIQEKLYAPEIRIYWINGELISFKIKCDSLDYRKVSSNNIEVKQVSTTSFDNNLLQKIAKLMAILELDFAAIDFKYNKEKKLHFLEVNDFPMFSYFDRVCVHKISDKIIEFFE